MSDGMGTAGGPVAGLRPRRAAQTVTCVVAAGPCRTRHPSAQALANADAAGRIRCRRPLLWRRGTPPAGQTRSTAQRRHEGARSRGVPRPRAQVAVPEGCRLHAAAVEPPHPKKICRKRPPPAAAESAEGRRRTPAAAAGARAPSAGGAAAAAAAVAGAPGEGGASHPASCPHHVLPLHPRSRHAQAGPSAAVATRAPRHAAQAHGPAWTPAAARASARHCPRSQVRPAIPRAPPAP